MDSNLYAKVRNSARYCRNPVVRFRINVFLKVLKEGNVEAVCGRLGIARMTYYRWWKRFLEEGVAGIEDRSRRPLKCPRQTSKKVVEKIKYYRKRYHYGPERISDYLRDNHQMIVCCSTIRRIILREGLILKKYRTKKVNPHKKRYELPWPGQMVQLDIKYVPERVQGKQLYAFNAIDDCTRWRFARIYDDKSLKSAMDFVLDLIRFAPFEIQVIQTDNDKVFTNRFSAFAKDPERHLFTDTLAKKGIRHRLIPPGAKELNGKVERSHRTDDDEFFWKAPYSGASAIKQAYAQWIWEYNHDRSHKSLGKRTPMEKLTEKTLVRLTTTALCLGLDPEKLFLAKPAPKKLTKMETYLKYLQYLESDYLPVTDVMEFHTQSERNFKADNNVINLLKPGG